MVEKYENFKTTFKNLTKEEVQSLDSLDIDLDELLISPPDERSSKLYLGIYSEENIREAFEKYGIFQMLKEKGFDDPIIVFDNKSTERQRIAIYFKETDENHLLCETILRRKNIHLNFPFVIGLEEKSFDFLIVDWLYSQNPQKKFSADRKRLPGQIHPGLNMARNVLKLLLLMTKKHNFSGIVNIPEHYHNAQLYSQYFSYLSPTDEAKRKCIERDLLSKYSLSTVSWAVDLNCVYENNSEFRWFVSEQIIPLDKKIIEYFTSEKYNSLVIDNMSNHSYRLDLDKWNDLEKGIEKYICI